MLSQPKPEERHFIGRVNIPHNAPGLVSKHTDYRRQFRCLLVTREGVSQGNPFTVCDNNAVDFLSLPDAVCNFVVLGHLKLKGRGLVASRFRWLVQRP
jgi:hypothetical protein